MKLQAIPFLLAAILFQSVPNAWAQCRLVGGGAALDSIGVLEALPDGDTLRLRTVYRGHEADRIYRFQRRGKGQRSATLMLQKQDGSLAGLVTAGGEVRFVAAASAADLDRQAGTFLTRPLGSLWQLAGTDTSRSVDDEALVFILAQHLEAAWPITQRLASNPTLAQRLYAQGESEEACRAACLKKAAAHCPSGKLQATDERVCDDGRWVTLSLAYRCAPKTEGKRKAR